MDKHFDEPDTLMQQTIQLVKQTGVDQASFQTQVPAGWLQKFCSGTFKSPGVNRIQHIYEILSNTKLIK